MFCSNRTPESFVYPALRVTVPFSALRLKAAKLILSYRIVSTLRYVSVFRTFFLFPEDLRSTGPLKCRNEEIVCYLLDSEWSYNIVQGLTDAMILKDYGECRLYYSFQKRKRFDGDGYDRVPGNIYALDNPHDMNIGDKEFPRTGYVEKSMKILRKENRGRHPLSCLPLKEHST